MYPVTLSNIVTHTAPQYTISSDDQLTCINEKGYRTAKSTHGFTHGTYLFSATFLNTSPTGSNVRIGVGQMSADLQAPLGYDMFGWSWRGRPVGREDNTTENNKMGGGVFHEAKRVQTGNSQIEFGFGKTQMPAFMVVWFRS